MLKLVEHRRLLHPRRDGFRNFVGFSTGAPVEKVLLHLWRMKY